MNVRPWRPNEAYIVNDRTIFVRTTSGGFMGLIDPGTIILSNRRGDEMDLYQRFPTLHSLVLDAKVDLVEYLRDSHA